MSDENPWRSVEIRPITGRFQLGKYEVTMGQWTEVMGTTPWFDKPNVQSHKDYPAVYISWDHVQEFIARLNTGWGSAVFRLPTEAEWEYACRAGTTTKWSFGDDETQLERYAWYENNTLTETGTSRRAMPFGGKRSNHWFLYDMHGNVAEWVRDRYGSYQELMTENLEYSEYYEGDPWFNPRGPKTGSQRVYRGGSYIDKADDMRSAARFSAVPNSSGPSVGFRLLKADVPEWEEERFDLHMSMVKLEGFGSNEYEDFWLSKYEVTQYQWAEVMGTTPWEGKGVVEDLSHPAVYISWNDVQEFINRLNERTGDQWYRLPTEAEWEYACRAGTETPWSFGAGEDRLKHYAWYDGNTSQYQRVGWKGANPWGLHDMHGNVWEWVQDRDADDDSKRIGRGGSFKSNAQSVGSAHRSSADPDLRNDQVGFRLVRVEEPASWAINRATDRAALEALYHATNGDNWTNNDNWLSDRPLGEWHGVTADDKGRVVELSLSGNELGGEIPSALGNLSNLRVLYLHANELRGSIPQSYTSLSLRRFRFDNGSGGLCAPADEAFQNWLQGIDDRDDGPNCSEASEAPLATDRAALEALYHATNGDNWKNSNNWLSDRPLGEWYGVTTDDEGRVVELNLSYNDLSGEIPATLGGLSNLERLDLSYNYNDLSGEIPATLGDLSNLERLSLSSNDLSGLIPSALGNLSSLERLSLSSNDLSGEIPSALGNLSNLQELYLSGNELRGLIPSALGDLSNLRELNLSSNELSGEIPATLGNLSNLEGLDLSDNDLSGEIPATLGDLSNLRGLNLFDNELSGEIPQSYTSLSLRRFRFDNGSGGLCAPADEAFQNWLQGIRYRDDGPNCLEAPEVDRAALEALYHATDGDDWTNNNNWLSSRPLGEWRGVTTDGEGRVVWLSLDDNELSGEIPSALGDLSNLRLLRLHVNDLSGEIPSTLGNLSNLERLILRGNELRGEIPSTLGDLSNLERLDLSGNELSGEIPSALGNLSNLQELDLSDNELSGSIPATLGDLSNLERLDLSFNELSGEIPQSYTSLSLRLFWFNGFFGLCAPADEAFQNWLRGIGNRKGPNCSE